MYGLSTQSTSALQSIILRQPKGSGMFFESVQHQIAQIQKKVTEGQEKERGEQESKRKGLEFMAIRFNIIEKRRDLRNELTPAENYLLDEIELATIGGRNEKRTIASEAEIYLDDLAQLMRYKTKNKIWTLLKSLEKKGLIIRKPTRLTGKEIIGLNPDVFGQLLIDKHDAVERRKSMHTIRGGRVDNSHSEPTVHESSTHEACVKDPQTVSDPPTNRECFHSQTPEIIEEKTPLDSFRLIDSFKLENQGFKIDQKRERKLDWTEVSGDVNSPTVGLSDQAFQERTAFLHRQLEALKAGKL